MAEYINSSAVTVAAGQNVPFTETAVCGMPYVIHRVGAGIVTLKSSVRGSTRYKVTFGGNIAIPDGGTVEAISAAIAVSGEPLTSATAIITPTATEEYENIFVAVVVNVPCGCCVTVSVENTSTQAVTFQNSNLTVDRVC